MGITECRVCGNQELKPILSLGNMAFTGIFPRDKDEVVHNGELGISLCTKCTLVQLDKSFPGELLYGDSYGYRSGLNRSMVEHLGTLVDRVKSIVSLERGDVVCDVGSNDGTLLGLYDEEGLIKIGIDPSSGKFKHFYESTTHVVPKFFSKEAYFAELNSPAKVLTSVAMLYDLENPVQFAKDVYSVLEEDGIWLFEQSYMPWMVETGAYDTICHEHLEYYSMKSIREILNRANFVVTDAFFTEANGGSFTVIARKAGRFDDVVTDLDLNEQAMELDNIDFFNGFVQKVSEHGTKFGNLVRGWVSEGKSVVALGASTKGSVVLQHANLTSKEISAVGEVNDFKFGRLMSGTDIPIASEYSVMEGAPDYAIILPWHFKSTFEHSMTNYRKLGTKLVFPLPEIEII